MYFEGSTHQIFWKTQNVIGEKRKMTPILAQTMGSMELSLIETGKTTGGSGMYVRGL